ncbi:hypothetical protein [Enterococcus gallinarum]|nr:hypothetical protein [Enterococcus gallinarum]
MEHTNDSLDRGPFFHGTKASLQLGELLEPKKALRQIVLVKTNLNKT